MIRVGVLLSTYNRFEISRSCIIKLLKSELPDNVFLSIFLTDAASPDNTGERIKQEFPATRVDVTHSRMYWNAGMINSWKMASENVFDYFLLLNDDVLIEKNALSELLELSSATEKNVVVGFTVDPITRVKSYGSLYRGSGLSRNRFELDPVSGSLPVTFNANCVLVPTKAISEVGFLDSAFSHQYGDIDLGLRLHANGWQIVESRSHVGELARHDAYAHESIPLSFRNIMFIFRDPKGIPIREWWHFLWRWNGFLSFVYFPIRYIKVFGRMLILRISN